MPLKFNTKSETIEAGKLQQSLFTNKSANF